MMSEPLEALPGWDAGLLNEALLTYTDWMNPMVNMCLHVAYAVDMQGVNLTYRFRMEQRQQCDMLNASYNRRWLQEAMRRIEPKARVWFRLDTDCNAKQESEAQAQ